MGENSKIEWCDHTFNPWIGCTKVSPGCANCYAETLDRNRYSKTMDGGTKTAPVSHWGPGAARHRTSTWGDPVRWDKAAQGAPRSPRVFCASLADWLDHEINVEWLVDLLELIRETPNLDWLLLTKRPENWESRMRVCLNYGKCPVGYRWLVDRVAPSNVWVGTTVEDQKRADERIPHLLKIPAKVRFLSCEPLLGPLDLWAANYRQADGSTTGAVTGWSDCGVDWVICGGESGSKSRPMHPKWARAVRDACQASAVPFLFKQWGEWLPVDDHGDSVSVTTVFPSLKNPEFFTFDDGTMVARVGKKAAGRELDGTVHNQFPA